MATVILARHGRSSANTAGLLAGRSRGVRLDDLGTAQAAKAADRLAAVSLAAIVTSPQERCRATAAAISRAQAGEVAVRVDRAVAEVEYGAWTGRPIKELAKESLWKVVQSHPSRVVFPDGESLAGMSARVVDAVRRWDAALDAEHGPQAVWVLSSHGDPIKAVLADALGMHLDAFQRIVVDPGSLSVVHYSPLRPFVLSMNTTDGSLGHLQPQPRRRARGRAVERSSDAVVGGGSGPA